MRMQPSQLDERALSYVYSSPILDWEPDPALLSSGSNPESVIRSPNNSSNEIQFNLTQEDDSSSSNIEDWTNWNTLSYKRVFLLGDSPNLDHLKLVMNHFEIHTNGETFTDFKDSPMLGSMIEEPVFHSRATENSDMYSASPSWSQPIPGRLILSLEEQAKMRSIDLSSSVFSSPEPERRKRKSIAEEYTDNEEDAKERENRRGNGRPMKKTAHNMIEKRYRTNLNQKIITLGEAVPSLRAMAKSNAFRDKDDIEGLTPPHKLNKATVLSKATEYISDLEKDNKCLTKENTQLKSRIDAFQMLVMAQHGSGSQLARGES